MTTFYSDRQAVSINGAPYPGNANILSTTITLDPNVSVVDGMTSNSNVSGFTKGNNRISFSMTEAIPNTDSTFNWSSLDYESNDVQLNFFSSSNSYLSPRPYQGQQILLTGIVWAGLGNSFSGPGKEGQITNNFYATTSDILS